MTDERIIELYWHKDERAISQTQTKYGKFCYTIAYNLLNSNEDAEECENDTYLGVWNAIPPQHPNCFAAFLGKITRNLSLKKLRSRTAQKRTPSEGLVSLEELRDCIPDGQSFDECIEERALAELISDFLRGLPIDERRLFICRYWYCDPISKLTKQFGYGQSKVKMMLLRTRRKLLAYLEEKGVFV